MKFKIWNIYLQRSIRIIISRFQISPLVGINSAYVFYGAGSVVTSGEYQTDEKYSGVVFGYNEDGVFVWRAKPSIHSKAFLITNPWGDGQQSQRTNDVRIDIQVFGLMARGLFETYWTIIACLVCRYFCWLVAGLVLLLDAALPIWLWNYSYSWFYWFTYMLKIN